MIDTKDEGVRPRYAPSRITFPITPALVHCRPTRLSMRVRIFLSFCATIFAAVTFLAHTQTIKNLGSGPCTAYGGGFTLNQTSYYSILYQSNIVAAPRWDPSQPLPLSLEKAVQIARAEFHKLVPDDRGWKLDSIHLASLATSVPAPEDAWYYRIRFAPTIRSPVDRPYSRTYAPEAVEIAVDFAGKPGLLSDRFP